MLESDHWRLAKRGLVGFLGSLTKLTALPPSQSKPFLACANQMPRARRISAPVFDAQSRLRY